MSVLTARAPAKINLTLHVLGRRDDGFHELHSLVAFAGAADRLRFAPASGLSLTLAGATAAAAGAGPDNLVLRAARHLADRVEGARLGAFHLQKNLPVAAGIGGGSSDAAAALRLLAQHNGLGVQDPRVVEAARATGADVPVCLHPQARAMGGIGHEIGPPLEAPPMFAVLVNPRVAVETRAVFAALGLKPGQRLAGQAVDETADLDAAIRNGRNDLEAPALRVAPVIAEVLARLRALPGVTLARMSGSGATCFALFPSRHAAAGAARALRATRPDWWIRPTLLR